jgi:phosphoserine aminotransferase
MTQRIYNFSAGPAVLPEPVLATAQRELMALPGVGASILEISHRSQTFREIIAAAEANLRTLLAIGDDYAVLFLQGGSRLQFSMIPMNLLTPEQSSADYLITGSWGKHACKEARKFGPMQIVWDGNDSSYSRLPDGSELQFNPSAAYLHYTSNETIQGVQFATEPEAGDVPLVCDASSDFLYRPTPIERYGLLYACAQKNAGPAGVTVVIVRKDLLARSRDNLPIYLNYKAQADAGSLMNTAPTFAIYIVRLVTEWLIHEIGGLESMYRRNQEKARMLYTTIDNSGDYYQGHARSQDRSLMNVVFRLPSDELTQWFLSQAHDRGLTSLAGHRSVGGIRASIYNAMPLAGVEALRDFMLEFQDKNG